MTFRPIRRTLTCLATLCIAASVGVPSLAMGQAERFTFRLDRQDRAALDAHRKAKQLRAQAEQARAKSNEYGQRLLYFEDLLVQAEGDEQRLRAALDERLAERYKRGATADMSFLLGSQDVRDAVDRGDMLADADRADRLLMARYASKLEYVEDLRSLLEDLRDRTGERATALEQQAGELDSQLVAARERHEHDHLEQLRSGAGDDGVWNVVDGELPPGFSFALSPAGTLPYSGGTRTPARRATAAQAAAVLNHPNIEIYAGGRSDIASGRIDGRVLDALLMIAQRFGSLHVASLQTGHGVYTSGGNVSEHAYGCAVDIGSVSGIRIQSSTQGRGSITERVVMFLAQLRGDMAPHQVISLNSYGGPTLGMGDHHDHIHLGYSCRR